MKEIEFIQNTKKINNNILRNSKTFPFLFINEQGTVIFNNKTNKILDIYPHKNGFGYLQCTGGYWVHRIVAETYCEKIITDKQLEVNHKDGNKTNNNYQNLEWITHSENIKHSFNELGHTSYWLNKKMSTDICKMRSERMTGAGNVAAKARKIYFSDGTEIIAYTRQEILLEMKKRGYGCCLSTLKRILNNKTDSKNYGILNIEELGRSIDLLKLE